MKNMGKNDILKLMHNPLPGSGLIRLDLHQHGGENLVSHPGQALVCPAGRIDTSGLDNPVHPDGNLPVPGLAGGPRPPGGEGGNLHICPSVHIQYRLVGSILRPEIPLLRIDSDRASLADDTADHNQVLAGIKERRPAARPLHPLGELRHGSELQHNGAQ